MPIHKTKGIVFLVIAFLLLLCLLYILFPYIKMFSTIAYRQIKTAIDKDGILNGFNDNKEVFELAVDVIGEVFEEEDVNILRVDQPIIDFKFRENTISNENTQLLAETIRPLYERLPIRGIYGYDHMIVFLFSNEQRLVYTRSGASKFDAEVERERLGDNWYYIREDAAYINSIG